MKINKNLYLTLTIKRDNGALVHAHSAPLSTAVFDTYADVLEDTYGYFQAKFRERMAMGPSRALTRLMAVAKELGQTEAVERGLLPEVRRSTNVALFTGRAWEEMLLQDAIDKQSLDSEEVREIESNLLFFTLVWHLFPVQRSERLTEIATMMDALRKQTTSSDFTAQMNSWRTSIEAENSGESAKAA